MNDRQSLARVFDEPVLLCRRMCEHCRGQGKVPTPEMAGWSAEVERYKADALAAGGGPRLQREAVDPAYETARRQAGSPPEPSHAKCNACDGDGYQETELALDELSRHLGLGPSGKAP